MAEVKITTAQDVLDMVEDNHIWLNAFSCVDPTPKFCEDLGRQIIQMLWSKENLLPSYNGDISGEKATTQETLNHFATLTPTLYLSINKS